MSSAWMALFFLSRFAYTCRNILIEKYFVVLLQVSVVSEQTINQL